MHKYLIVVREKGSLTYDPEVKTKASICHFLLTYWQRFKWQMLSSTGKDMVQYLHIAIFVAT